uniref:Uncharacterized protein n=2 Tax=Caenorhabditis japonica TaxID=281687 RepID=A0A8R1II63_CAEJA
MVAKSIMNESEMMSKGLKSKIEATKGLRRLKEFTSARDTALQLVYTQHALILYQRPDLHQICQRFIKSGMALAEKIRKLSLSEREFIGFQQIDFSSVNSSMIDFLSDVKRLPQMMVVEGKSLKSFGHGLFVLDKVEMPFVDFDSMIKTLDRSKLTSIGRSKEVLEAEKSLESFKSLQYALRNKNSLFELLARADTFFESFFFKPLILKTKWTSIALIIISLATILLVVLLCWFLRTRHFENKRETAGKFDVKGKCKQMKSISAQRFVHIEAKGKDRYQEGRRKASK